MKNYCIVRYFAPHLDKRPETVKTGLTKSQAVSHCNDPTSRKEGEWFDMYKDTGVYVEGYGPPAAWSCGVKILKEVSLTQALRHIYSPPKVHAR